VQRRTANWSDTVGCATANECYNERMLQRKMLQRKNCKTNKFYNEIMLQRTMLQRKNCKTNECYNERCYKQRVLQRKNATTNDVTTKYATTNESYNKRCGKEQMLQRKILLERMLQGRVFINKIRMLQRTRPAFLPQCQRSSFTLVQNSR
jgi:hypothetical protein